MISKTTSPLTLWKTTKGYVEVDKNTLALPIMLRDSLKGYVFHGCGRLVLDMIIETEQGAVGRPVESRTVNPFMMIGGEYETIRDSLHQASQEDLIEFGYSKQQEFVSRAGDLLDRFRRSLGPHGFGFSNAGNGAVFAFQEETNGLDILFAAGEKMVYKTNATVFITNGNKAVLKNPDGLVCVSNGKSTIVKA